jgi:hypothetical protein
MARYLTLRRLAEQQAALAREFAEKEALFVELAALKGKKRT